MIVRRVWKNKSSGQLLITIPKDSGISDGDFVKVYSENEKPKENDDSITTIVKTVETTVRKVMDEYTGR